MVTIDTPSGVATNEETLVAFSAALDAVRGTTGAGTSIDVESGVVSATFSLEAADVQGAVEDAVAIFNTALERVGLPHGGVVHVDAEPIEDRRVHALA